MKPILSIALLILLTNSFSCNGQSEQKGDSLTIDWQKGHLIPESDMLKTTDAAVKLIQRRNYSGLRLMFAPEVAANIPEQQLSLLVDQIATLFEREGVPSGNQDVLPALNASIRDGDTFFVNNIMYQFKPTDGGANKKVLTFSFHEKFGASKLIGINLNVNPLSGGGQAPKIGAIKEFEFSISEVSRFRIYYDEGVDKHTKYRNETGYFAVEGDNAKLKAMGVEPIIAEVLRSLAKIKPAKPKPFSVALEEGENTRFIQVDLMFTDKPYGLFIYFPIEGGGQYSGKIVVEQREFANIGYRYILDQSHYPDLVSAFPRIAQMNLDRYYEEKP